MSKQICSYLLSNFGSLLVLPLSNDSTNEDHNKAAEGFIFQCKIKSLQLLDYASKAFLGLISQHSIDYTFAVSLLPCSLFFSRLYEMYI